jgi:hypothetical protein
VARRQRRELLGPAVEESLPITSAPARSRGKVVNTVSRSLSVLA